MKKSTSFKAGQTRQPRTRAGGGVGASTFSQAAAVKLPAGRKPEPAGLLEEHFPDSEAHLVTFEYFNPTARQVLVAGSFNDWQPDASPMAKQRGGKWTTELLLKPGEYQYRFVVDGAWQDDPMAARFVANPFGGLNCVVEVKSTESRP